MAEKIVLSDKEKEIIGMLDDSLYTVEYIEEWINRNATQRIMKNKGLMK